jgi:hypothetical protein
MPCVAIPSCKAGTSRCADKLGGMREHVRRAATAQIMLCTVVLLTLHRSTRRAVSALGSSAVSMWVRKFAGWQGGSGPDLRASHCISARSRERSSPSSLAPPPIAAAWRLARRPRAPQASHRYAPRRGAPRPAPCPPLLLGRVHLNGAMTAEILLEQRRTNSTASLGTLPPAIARPVDSRFRG